MLKHKGLLIKSVVQAALQLWLGPVGVIGNQVIEYIEDVQNKRGETLTKEDLKEGLEQISQMPQLEYQEELEQQLQEAIRINLREPLKI